MAHQIQIKELINGIQITETVDAEVVIKLLSYQGKPFFRTTNETDEETYQIIDKVGEIYNLPALATEFVLIDLNDTVYIPANGEELVEYSVKLKPFRGDNEADEFHIGEIETTANSVTINLPGDGVNWAKIDGSFYERYYPDTFNFTPVTANQKILIVYAVPDELPFRLAQGIESAEAIEPDYNGLFIARIIVNTVGEVVEEEDNGYKVRSEDGWRTINNSTAAFIALGNNPAGSFHLTGSSDVQGCITKQGKFLWPGREFVIKTDQAVTLKASEFIDTSNARHWTFAEDYELKADSWAILKEKSGEILLVKMGGSAEFPEGNAGDVLVKGASEWEASGRLTDVENEIDAEVVNRSAADTALQTQITTEQNKTASVVDKMLHYWDATLGRWFPTGVEFVSSTLLEFAGKIKLKGIIIDETTDAIQAREIKFKNNKFKAAANDGVEKNMLLEGDAVFNFDQFIASYYTDDLTIVRPNSYPATTYFSWNVYGSNFFQAGASRLDNSINSVLYSSAGATLGRVHGNFIYFYSSLTARIFRKFSIDTVVPTQRVFVGYSDNWRAPGANPTNVPMSSLTGIIGVCMESGNPNLLFIHNDSTGSATLVDTGFIHATKYNYEFTLSHDWGETFLTARLRRIDRTTGFINDSVYQINSDYSTNNMAAALWCVDELNTSVVKVMDYGLMAAKRINYL